MFLTLSRKPFDPLDIRLTASAIFSIANDSATIATDAIAKEVTAPRRDSWSTMLKRASDPVKATIATTTPINDENIFASPLILDATAVINSIAAINPTILVRVKIP